MMRHFISNPRRRRFILKSLFYDNFRLSYKKRVLFTVYLCVAVPTLILCLVIVLFAFNGYKNDLETLEKEFYDIQKSELNHYMDSLSDKFGHLISYDELNRVLISDEALSFEEAYINTKKLTNSLDGFFLGFAESNLEIYTDNENIYQSKYIKKFDDSVKKEFESVIDEGKIYISFFEKDENVYFNVMQKHNLTDENYCIIKISINSDLIFENSSYKKENFTVVYDKENKAVIPLNVKEKSKSEQIFNDFLNGKNGDYRAIISDDILSGYTIYNFLDIKELKQKTIYEILLYIILFIIVGLLIVIFVNRVVESLTGRLTMIVTDILSTDNSLAVFDSQKVYDEFDIIQFKLNDFKKKLIKENHKIVELELQQLGNRISPHFFYNILAAIKCRITDKETLIAIEYLVKYYRKAFHQSEVLVSLEQEIENVELYRMLLQYAYDKDFLFEIEIENVSLKYPILSQIIQPIVENAFIHGINSCEDIYGEILLKIFSEDDNIVIEIRDNGMTADFDKINAILSDLENLNSALKIINKRIKLYYGKKYGITYFDKNGYTVARLEMPYIFTEEKQ